MHAAQLRQQAANLAHLRNELVLELGAAKLRVEPIFATVSFATLGAARPRIVAAMRLSCALMPQSARAPGFWLSADALADLVQAYEDDLAVKAAMAVALPAASDRAVALQYLMTWMEEPLIDDARWAEVEALVRTEANWPAPSAGIAAASSPRR